MKTQKSRHRIKLTRRRHRRSRRTQGGDVASNMLNAVKLGLKQGIKNTPQAVYKSLRSSGSTYGSPGNSIAGLAGNNIANILRANENALRSGIREGILKIRAPSPSTPRFSTFSPIVTPITPRAQTPKPLPKFATVVPNLTRKNIVPPINTTFEYQ